MKEKTCVICSRQFLASTARKTCSDKCREENEKVRLPAMRKQWQRDNPDKTQAAMDRYLSKPENRVHREVVRRKRYFDNRPEHLRRAKLYREANKGKIKSYRLAWYAKNRDWQQQRNRERQLLQRSRMWALDGIQSELLIAERTNQ